mgnify:FL=1
MAQTSVDQAASLAAFRDASMEFDHVYDLLAKSSGLSYPEFWSLVLIRDGVLTQREIISQLRIGPQPLNSAFKLLVKKGFIRLEPFEHDQRSKRALLTPPGARCLTERILPALRLEEQAWLSLTEEEQAALPRITHKFSTALRRALDGRDN